MAQDLSVPVPILPRPKITVDARVLLRKGLDLLMRGLSIAGALGAVGLLVALTTVLLVGAMPAIKLFGWGFLTSSDWDPVEQHFGALPFVYGTFVSSVLALLISVPLSVGAALFLVRIAPGWLSGPVSFLIELLAAIPSIVFGFWGRAALIPYLQEYVYPFLKGTLGALPGISFLFNGSPQGQNMLTAGIVLAIMVTPIITAVGRDVLLTVPKDIEEGANALGATWWQASIAILNFGKIGIFGAVILGFARAIGETMAVTMVIGNNNDLNFSLLAPSSTMSSLLANEFQNADTDMYVHALVYLAFVLLALTVVLNGIARLLVNKVKNEGKHKTPSATRVTFVLGLIAYTLLACGGLWLTRVEGAQWLGWIVFAIFAAILQGQVRMIWSSSISNAGSDDKRAIAICQLNYFVRYINAVFKTLCISAALVAIVFLLLIFGYVVFKGFTSLSWEFFTCNPGPPGSPIGMKNAIIGTIMLVLMASCIGVPLGMLCGVYLAEYAKKTWYNDIVRLAVDVLAGTPSIIVGVLAYELVIAKSGILPSLELGNSGIGGAMALAFLMVPIIARTTEEMLRLVPLSYREASLALGGAKYQTILEIVVPAAKTGIVTGIMLSIARIAGETAPLIFTAVGSDQDVYNPFKPFPALTLKIFQYAQSSEDKWVQQAWAGMLVLIFMITVLSVAVRYVTRNKKHVRR